jgi:colanic acid/amylovoran biosynthesis glycosyltransferase
MRIAMIVGGFPLISETFILNQVTGLIDLGHDVQIFARRSNRDLAVHADVHRYGLLQRTHHYDLPAGRGRRVARAAISLLGGLRRRPGLLRCVNPGRYGTPYNMLNNAMHAPPILRYDPDAIMCHFGTNGIDFIFLKDLLPDVPFVTMFHKGDILLGDERTPAVYTRLRQHGDAFLAISDSWNRRKLVEFGFDNRRIVTHRIGVDVARIPFRPRAARGNDLDILTVARLHPEKGLHHGITAAAALRAARKDLRVRYRIIGGGDAEPDLRALIDRLGVADAVTLLGPQPTAEVLAWMQRSDVFLLPSLAEGTPTVLIEAQASGLPIVATDVGGVRDILPDGRSGFLVPGGDSGAMIASLRRLVDQPERWEEMGRAGRAFVAEHHDIQKLNRTLAELLARLGAVRRTQAATTPDVGADPRAVPAERRRP